VTESRMWQTSCGRSVSGMYAMPEPARWGFAMLGGWLPGFGPQHTSEDCWTVGLAVLASMIENQLMVLGHGLHKSIAFNGVGCSSCLGLGSSPDRSSSAGVHVQRLERGTLEMEVREIQSYTAVFTV